MDWIRSIQVLHIKMASSKTFDMNVHALGELVNEVCTGTDNNQKAKLKAMLDHFIIICTNAMKRKPNCENDNIQPKKMRLSVMDQTKTRTYPEPRTFPERSSTTFWF